MRTAELDLGTRLDWVAVDHYDTEHPHTHIVLRGRNADGTDLVIPKEYIAHGLRQRACERFSVELGPESVLERWRKVTSEIEQERLTGLDRQLVDRAEDGLAVLDQRDRMLKVRLKRLEDEDRWRLDKDLELRLRRLGERGDIIKTMNRALRRAGIERPRAGHRENSNLKRSRFGGLDHPSRESLATLPASPSRHASGSLCRPPRWASPTPEA
jgi:type IV secretory pathway VirD2 relaxase